MKQKFLEKVSHYRVNSFSSILAIILFGIVGFVAYQEVNITDQTEKTEKIAEKLSTVEQKANDLETILLSTQEKNTTLSQALEDARERSERLERQFDRVNDNVDDLEKITRTDPELLRKYSKISFLNENYIPSDLETIPSKYTYNKDRRYEVHEKVYSYLIDLLKEAEDDNIDLQVISAFRSFGEQSILKGSYLTTYGEGANQFSADQGYSEHQLGTTVDFTTPSVGATYSGFAQTEAYEWLQDNAHRYGFTLSYPKENEFYQFEPWHWRFVGRDLADDLRDDNQNFYDLSQREIDEYVVDLFD